MNLRKRLVVQLRKWLPKRITQYGSLAYHLYDDRSLTEKVVDKLEEVLQEKPRRYRDTSIWHTYFDYSMGKLVDGYNVIRQHEKEGRVRMTFEEMERTAKIYRDRSQKEYREKIKEGIRESLHQVKQGRSFYKEQLRQVPRDMQLKAERMRAAQGTR